MNNSIIYKYNMKPILSSYTFHLVYSSATKRPNESYCDSDTE